MRPHLQYAMEAYSANLITDSDHHENVECLAGRLMKGSSHVEYKKLQQLNLVSLKHKRFQFDLILTFTISKYPYEQRLQRLQPPKFNLLLIIMRWKVYRLARLIGKVVRFQHRGTH